MVGSTLIGLAGVFIYGQQTQKNERVAKKKND